MVRSFRSIAAALAALAIPLAAAPTAPADVPTYTQYACHTPDGAPAPVDGFGSTVNNGGTAVNDCASGGGLTMTVPATSTSGSNVSAGWTYDAPPDVTIASISYHRTIANVGASDASTTREWQTPGETCGPGVPCPADSTIDAPLSSMWFATFLLHCQPDNACYGPYAGDGRVVVDRLAIALEDPDAPQFVRPPSGDLFSSGPVSGTRSVTFTASDNGGGIYTAAFVVDGTQQPVTIVDRNGGACVEPFVTALPCKGTVEPTLELDTTKLPNGKHTIGIVVYDATGKNSVSSSPATVDVENAATSPSAAGPEPATSGGPMDTGGTASATAGSSAPPAARLSVLGRARRGRLSCRYGRLVTIYGRVLGVDRRPRPGLTIEATSVRTGSRLATTVTNAQGRFRLAVRAMSSQDIVVHGAGSNSMPIRLLVRPPLLLSPSNRHVHNGQVLSLQARTPVRGRAHIAFQVQIGKNWRTFAVTRLGGNGTATVEHRFTVTYTRLTYRFRALLVPGHHFPFSSTRSNSISVRVN